MKYRTIVIDPPWAIKMKLEPQNIDKFKNQKSRIQDKRYCAKPTYDTMTDQQLLDFKLPVDIADNAVLFLWTVNRKLQFSFELLKKWDFKFKTCMVWQKKTGHNGNVPLTCFSLAGIHANAEYVLIGFNGKFALNYSHPIPMVFSAKIRGHSVKPPEFYQLIRRSTPEPRIDIFARRRHEGFDAFGDQVQNKLQTTLRVGN